MPHVRCLHFTAQCGAAVAELVASETLRDPDAKRAADALWAIIEVASGSNVAALESATFYAWQSALRELSPEGADARTTLGLAMFEALAMTSTLNTGARCWVQSAVQAHRRRTPYYAEHCERPAKMDELARPSCSDY